ncbi:Spo0E family sporulation regulatory protein-aspartic acid phosphatase [Paenibacillus oleatilyticus]|uniref:Spo0E family sporulation regulatory protein-aspartic acid phosphatase n=1 Tax=Paenibacillus oleatilyticus TaxID=2594886 RepID=A0ABV4UWY5_9BACL
MCDLESLLIKIEKLRAELNALSKSKELSDPEVIAASQRLDDALNEYETMKQSPTGRS